MKPQGGKSEAVMRLSDPRESVENADWLNLTAGEEVLWAGRPSRFTIALRVIGGVVLAILGIGLSVWLLPVAEAAAVPRWTGYLPLSLVVVGLALAAFAYLNWVRLLYVITDEEIYVKYGFISRDVTQIRLARA